MSNEHNNAPVPEWDNKAYMTAIAGLRVKYGISHAMADLYYESWVELVRHSQKLEEQIARMNEHNNAPAVPQVPVLEERSPEYWASKYPVPLGYALVKKDTASSQEPAVPQGWKLVPVEPTRAMWAAVNKLDDEMAAGSYDGKGCSIEQAWNCMLDFAPDAPALAATPAPAPAQEAGLTDDEIFHLWDVHVAYTPDKPCKYPLTKGDILNFSRAIIAALRAKGAV